MNDGAASPPPLIVLFDPEALRPDGHESALRAEGYRVERVDRVEEAIEALDRGGVAALVVVEGRSGPGPEARVCHAARDRGIPVLGLIDHNGDAQGLKARVAGFDGWAHYACPAPEVVARLAELVLDASPAAATGPGGSPVPMDLRLLATVVHDIRNPLNVIGLTLRVIEQLPTQQRGDLQEDLGFLRDNANQIERILGVLSDLCRLGDLGPPSPVEVDPRRFVADLVEERSNKATGRTHPARFVAGPDTPDRVELDPIHARLALTSALINAASASEGPLTVATAGGDGRWSVAIVVDRPPPPTVQAYEARPDRYERVIASTSERRGLDLAVASWLVRQSGGTVRLDVESGVRSSIILEWPEKRA